jgi:hypothetical protein
MGCVCHDPVERGTCATTPKGPHRKGHASRRVLGEVVGGGTIRDTLR